MGSADELVDAIIDHGERFSTRVGDLKSFLAIVQSTEVDANLWSSQSQDARALSVVCVAAELEALTTAVIQEVHSTLNSATIRVYQLVRSVRQLVAHTTFESLRDIQDHAKLWPQRQYATTLDVCTDVAIFPVISNRAQPPLDGRTLRPEHYYRLWGIYSLPGEVFPRASWSGSLLKVASARNDIAHANLPYAEIFKQAGRSTEQIGGYVDDIASFADHFVTTWCEYVAEKQYIARE